jgi:hypothetical protein
MALADVTPEASISAMNGQDTGGELCVPKT